MTLSRYKQIHQCQENFNSTADIFFSYNSLGSVRQMSVIFWGVVVLNNKSVHGGQSAATQLGFFLKATWGVLRLKCMSPSCRYNWDIQHWVYDSISDYIHIKYVMQLLNFSGCLAKLLLKQRHWWVITGLILGLHPANERRRCKVTPPLIIIIIIIIH